MRSPTADRSVSCGESPALRRNRKTTSRQRFRRDAWARIRFHRNASSSSLCRGGRLVRPATLSEAKGSVLAFGGLQLFVLDPAPALRALRATPDEGVRGYILQTVRLR